MSPAESQGSLVRQARQLWCQGQATSGVRKEATVLRMEHLGGLAPAGRDVRRNGTRWIDARTRPKRMEVERTAQGNFSLSKPYFYIFYILWDLLMLCILLFVLFIRHTFLYF